MVEVRRTVLDRLGEQLFDRLQAGYMKKDPIQAEASGRRLGRFLFRLDKKHRKRTISNLKLAFPEWSEAKRLQTAQSVFEHFGIVAGDFMRTPSRTDTEVFEHMEVEGLENFELAQGPGKGILVITAHLGNWERFAQWVRASGREISVVARDANQRGVQLRVSRIREATGVRLLSRGDSAKEILLRLRNDEIVGLLPDQNDDECFVPFFGHPAGTVLGPAILHRRTGASLLPSYCVRTGPGTYKMVVLPPLNLDRAIKDPVEIMALVNATLEAEIRKYPEQWLWMHDRWKNARNRGLIGATEA